MVDPIFVTRPDLPPLADLIPLLEEIWQSRILTNNGPFHLRFERELSAALEVDQISLVCNGAMALAVALEAAELEGEVITTPYSFVATCHAMRLGRLQPVFVDIRPHDLNIDPARIEEAITDRTTAIVGVHVYGNPCAVDDIQRIAEAHRLSVIYDAAHAFRVRYRGRSLLAEGDFSCLSFHATKAFNTFEGGAVVARTAEGKQAVDNRRNFGILDEVTIPSLGTNAKMSEFNAALGLLQLARFEDVRLRRRRVDSNYRELLDGVPGITCLPLLPDVEPNYSYFPILVGRDFRTTRDGLYEDLKDHTIFSRRYFYPLLSNLPMYRDLPSSAPDRLPVANRLVDQILCLPIYPDLEREQQERIVRVIGR